MRRKELAAAAALLLLAACASEHPAPYDCDVDPSVRPLGRKIIPFIGWVGNLPAATGEECSTRGAMLGDDWNRFVAYRGDEVDATASHIRYLGDGLGADCGARLDNMTREFEFHGDRLREDTHCFFTRAWHALKMVE